MNVMAVWLQAKYPDAIGANGIHLPLAKDAIIGFFGHLAEPAHFCDLQNIHADDAPTVPLSVSCVTGYRSALVDLYRSSALALDAAVEAELKQTLEGYEKTINELKRRGLMGINEGKHHLKWSGYDLLATKLMTQTPAASGQNWPTVVFGWRFFVLMWNLMSRSESVDKIMLQHIEWGEDALVIEEQGHKGDQTGVDKYGKHVYANPYEPAKCPVLALAVLLFCSPQRTSGRHQLFVGTDSKGRFGRILHKLLSQLDADELRIVGCDPKDIGIHSLRKGSSTHALSQVNGPTPVSVYLRMGQSLGRLKDRYIQHGEGADQLCGRMITGLPFDSERFAVLPPHFHSSANEILTVRFWSQIVAGFNKYPRSAQTTFPHLLASLLYHERYLQSVLKPNHPIFAARVFTNNPHLELLRSSVLLTIGSSPGSTMKASGIPPHLALATQMKKNTEKLTEIDRKMDAMAAQVGDHVENKLRESCTIDGAIPVTMREMDARLDAMRDAIFQRIGETTGGPGTAVQQVQPSQWRDWNHGDGRICHYVPRDWEFPARTSAKTMWDLWHYGDKTTGIRPYRLLSLQHDLQVGHAMRHCRAKAVMEAIEELARQKELIPSAYRRVTDMPLELSDEVFAKSFSILIEKLYTRPPARPDDVSCGTLYNKLCIFRKSQ